MLFIFKNILLVPSSRYRLSTSSQRSRNVYLAKSFSKISSCVMKMIMVGGSSLYFVVFPDFNRGVSKRLW